jgi:hypothetical protein
MHNKKGLELSINFIVILIMSLLIFFLGARFIYQLGSGATDLQSITVDELDKQIGNLVCKGSERVCLGFDKKTIKRGDLGIFGLNILNVLEDQSFDVIITRPVPSGYTKVGNPISSDNLEWKPQSRTVEIKRNEEKDLAIGVQVPKDALSGTYIFNVEIKTQAGEDYDTLHKIYVDVP